MDRAAGSKKEKPKFAPPVISKKTSDLGEKGGGTNRKEEGGEKEINTFVGARKEERCFKETTGGERNGNDMTPGLGKKTSGQMKKTGLKKTENLKARIESVDKVKMKNRKQKSSVDQPSKEKNEDKERLTIKTKHNRENKVRQQGTERRKKRVSDEKRADETHSKKVVCLTDSQYDAIFESATALVTPGDSSLDDARAVLREVELLQASIDQASHREEEKEPPIRGVSGDRKRSKGEKPPIRGVSGDRKRSKGEEPPISDVSDDRKRSKGEETLISGVSGDRKRSREEEETDDSSGSSEEREFDSWVQCSLPGCGKWRRLDEHVDLENLPTDWTCSHSSGPGVCEAVEEHWSGTQCDIINNSLVPGSLVWAHQSGYPWWPAMIERDPDTRTFCQLNRKTDQNSCRYHVTYLGDPVSRAWVCQSKVKEYSALTEDTAFTKKSLQSFRKKLKEAIQMATQAQSFSLKKRVIRRGPATSDTRKPQCGSLVRDSRKSTVE
ncbi:hypothetical protein UPYG_G00246440 [Umbra pygmaea]|uniref:Zinc finger CW-type PWWP domain protein 1 n=1 Tax=Umbra pygmaea TaxID=75934 RepID=A0ABD0WGJ8_UMBPY